MWVLLDHFRAIIHALVIGESVVETVVTNLELRRRCQIQLPNGKTRIVGFRCRQIKHTVHYRRWFVPVKIFYTYSVEMISVDGDDFNDHHIGYYPHMCSPALAMTRSGHWRALNAHIDAIKSCNTKGQPK